MPYNISHSDTSKPNIIIADGTLDTSTSLVFIGKNSSNIGEYYNENLLYLLENFAASIEPVNPVDGQLWYDTGTDQLKIHDTGKWYVIGFTGNTRIEVRNRLDTQGILHKTIENIVDDVIVTITVDDTTAWTPAASEFLEDGVTRLDTQFPTIQAGINMNTTNNYKFRGTATSAEYADLAERYAADKVLEPGTVVKIGGSAEITQTLQQNDTDVFGVISTAPAFEMNSSAGTDETHPYVALAGRVPCKVVGRILKGERLVTSNVPGHARAAYMADVLDYRAVIGRALEDHLVESTGIIEIVVGTK